MFYFNTTNVPMDTIENISAGNYVVELKDEFLCVVTEEIEIIEPNPLYLTLLTLLMLFVMVIVQYFRCLFYWRNTRLYIYI